MPDTKLTPKQELQSECPDNCAHCESVRAGAVEGMSAEQRHDSFWVVEQFVDGKSTGYWDGGSSRDFQPDIDKAIQFCRREDAYWATRGWHWTDVKITEHLYMEIDSRPKSQNGLPVKGWKPAPISEGMSAEQFYSCNRRTKLPHEMFDFGTTKGIFQFAEAYAGELREERDALKRDQEMLFTGIKVANAQQAEALERAERAESALAEAQELLGVMYGWAKYGEESDHWYYSEEQAPGWKADSERVSKLLGFKLKAKP